MIKKFYIYLKSDGFVETIKFSLKSITSFFYNKSQTNIYYKKETGLSDENDYDIRQLTLADVEALDFLRLKILPYKKWIENGSKLYVIYVDNTPAGFSWIHYGDYKFTHGYMFSINDDGCWAGPQFIHKNFRGKGLQRIIVAHNLNKEIGKEIFTSVSNNNVASNKCMKRNNFELIGTVTVINLFGKEIKCTITKEIQNKIVKQ